MAANIGSASQPIVLSDVSDEADVEGGVCHPGDLEPDYDGDFWADHDEDCHGTIDSNRMRREFPEGFRWSCCGGDGLSEGCQPGEDASLSSRYPDSPAVSSGDEECHHTGDLEPDYDGDFWADHDEDCHGTIDTNTMRREFPEGFRWSCCGGDGLSEGCEER